MDKQLTVIQVAQKLRRTKPVAYKMLRRGDFPNACEVDGVTYVPYEDVLTARKTLADGFVAELEKLGYMVNMFDRWTV